MLGNSRSYLKQKIKKRIRKLQRRRFMADYTADGLAVSGRNLSFRSDARFAAAWQKAVQLNAEGWKKSRKGVPNIEWRAHICCWAAQHALSKEGDFVECGVHTGLLSLTICHFLDFARLSRDFYLFDTFSGIPMASLPEREKETAQRINDAIYFDVWDIAKRNFAPFPNTHLIRGVLPDSIKTVNFNKISYLSIDLNNFTSEKLVIENVWQYISDGGIVIIDDYAFGGHEAQYEMWNDFAASVDRMIATLPTGQGILLK